MCKSAEVKETEMLALTIEYLESLIVPSKDLAFIFFAICYLKKGIDKVGRPKE